MARQCSPRRARRAGPWIASLAAALALVQGVAGPALAEATMAPGPSSPAWSVTADASAESGFTTSRSTAVRTADADPSTLNRATDIPLGSSAWQRIPDELAFGSPVPDQMLSDVTVVGSGFVAVGGAFDGAAAVWSSPDGIEWTRAPDSADLDGLVMMAVTSDGSRLAVVGMHGAAVSRDGIAWRRATGDFAGETRDVVSLGSTFVAVGLAYAGGSSWPSGPTTGAAWTSPDGLAWTAVPGFPGGEPGADVSIRSVVRGGPGLVAVGAVRHGERGPSDAAAWVSADGRNWTRAPDTADLRGAWMTDVAAGPGGLVAVGSTDATQPAGAVWTSPDGVHWTRQPASPALAVGPMSAVTAAANGYLAIGSNYHSLSQAAAWTSPDGRTWAQVPAPSDAFGLTRVVTGERGALALGWTMQPSRCGANGSYSRAAVWIEPPVTLPAQRAAPPPAPLPLIPGTWETRPPMPVAHSAGAVALGRDGRLYVFGGAADRGGRNVRLADVQRYDPATRRWTLRAPIPGPVNGRAAAVTGADGRIWVFNSSGNLYAPYDPATNRWGAFGRTPKGQIVVSAVAGPGRTLFVATADSARAVRLYALDPAKGRWTLRGALDSRAAGRLVPGVDGRLYSVTNERLWRVDPTSGHAVPLSRPPTGHALGGVARTSDGRIWLIGGSGQCGASSAVEVYDPATGRWAVGPSLPAGRAEGLAIVGRDGVIYALGGISGTATASMVALVPARARLSDTG